ncbi:MAG TPA: DUF4236 domain-containing protein [Chitinophagales bacterium]|nr:DUF4236 domain-containing protein [Chitinophagales bacterium]
MGFSFRKSVGFGPFRVNLSKSGIGTSIGVKGLRVGVNSKGQAYRNLSIPGTGIFSRKVYSNSNNLNQTSNQLESTQQLQNNYNVLGFEPNNKFVPTASQKIYLWQYELFLKFIPKFIVDSYFGFIGIFSRINIQKIKTFTDGKIIYTAYNKAITQNYDIALDELAKIKFTDNSDIYDLSAVCYFQLENFDKAAANFDNALKLMKTDRLKVLYANSLRALNRPTDNKKLLELYSEIYQNHSEDDEIAFAVGYYLYLDSQYQKSIEVLQKIKHESHMYLQALNGIASCYGDLKEYDKGIQVLQLAPLNQKHLDDELKTVHYNLADLYEAVGDNAKAIKHFNIIEVQDINFMDVNDRIKKLKQN